MKIEWKTCFKIGISIFLLYLCIYYWPGITGFVSTVIGAATPLILGGAIAYVLNILMSLYERHYFSKTKSKRLIASRRPVCMMLSILTLFAVVYLIIRLIVPELVSCIGLLFNQIPGAMKKCIDVLEKWDILPDDILKTLASIDWKSKMSEIIGVLTTGVGSIMDVVFSALSSVFSGLVTFFLALIFSIYILLGKEKLGKQCRRIMKRYLNDGWSKKITYALEIFNDCFRKYIIGQCTEAVILGLLCTLGMLILRLPYAAMIGALIAFTALIPVAGAYIGGGIGAFLILTISPVKAVIFIVFLVILQQFEGNIIYPRVVGSSMGLPAIWVLAAVTVGGGIMGIMGMLLGVPIAAALYRLLKNDVNKFTGDTKAQKEPAVADNPDNSEPPVIVQKQDAAE